MNANNISDYLVPAGNVGDSIYLNREKEKDRHKGRRKECRGINQTDNAQKKIAHMKDQLVVSDIKNTEDYIREYQKGKHRRNNLVKWVGGIAEVGAHIVSAYGAHK